MEYGSPLAAWLRSWRWQRKSPVHTGDKVEFNTVDFFEGRQNRPCRFGPVHTSDKVDRIGNSRLCCRFVAGFGNSRLSIKSTVLNSTLSPVCTGLPVRRRWSLLSYPFSQTPAHTTEREDHGYRLVYHAMCLLTHPAFAGYSSCLLTMGRLRLSRPGCLVLRRGGLSVRRRPPIQALTGPSVE